MDLHLLREKKRNGNCRRDLLPFMSKNHALTFCQLPWCIWWTDISFIMLVHLKRNRFIWKETVLVKRIYHSINFRGKHTYPRTSKRFLIMWSNTGQSMLDTSGHCERTFLIIRALKVKYKVTISKINLNSELKYAVAIYSPYCLRIVKHAKHQYSHHCD